MTTLTLYTWTLCGTTTLNWFSAIASTKEEAIQYIVKNAETPENVLYMSGPYTCTKDIFSNPDFEDLFETYTLEEVLNYETPKETPIGESLCIFTSALDG